MCAYYEDEQKVKKGDSAIYKNQEITIISAKHIRDNRTMDITYTINSNEQMINIPYKTAEFELTLLNRKV